jgi:dynein heavy chain
LNGNAWAELTNIFEMFERKTEKLITPPQDLEQLSECLNILTQTQGDLSNIESQFQPIHDQYMILEKYEVAVRPEEKQRLEDLPLAWSKFQQTLVEGEKYLHEMKSKFKAELLSSIEDFARSAVALKEDFLSKGPFNIAFGIQQAFKSINDYRNSISVFANNERNIERGLAVFKMEHTPSKDINGIFFT